MAKPALSKWIAEYCQADQRRCGFRLVEREEAKAHYGREQQSHVEQAKTATPRRHRERICCERQSKQQRTHRIEAESICLRHFAINGQVTPGKKECQDFPTAG